MAVSLPTSRTNPAERRIGVLPLGFREGAEGPTESAISVVDARPVESFRQGRSKHLGRGAIYQT